MRVRVRVCVCVCTYVYIHIIYHVYLHTCMYIYILNACTADWIVVAGHVDIHDSIQTVASSSDLLVVSMYNTFKYTTWRTNLVVYMYPT